MLSFRAILSDLQRRMLTELASKDVFEASRRGAYAYFDGLRAPRAFPSNGDIERLNHFVEALPESTGNAVSVVGELHEFGSPATVASTGGRYFGLVTGGALPVTLAARWLADAWDQCSALYKLSPINAKLETVCESCEGVCRCTSAGALAIRPGVARSARGQRTRSRSTDCDR